MVTDLSDERLSVALVEQYFPRQPTLSTFTKKYKHIYTESVSPHNQYLMFNYVCNCNISYVSEDSPEILASASISFRQFDLYFIAPREAFGRVHSRISSLPVACTLRRT